MYVAGLTDVGIVRSQNEDAIFFSNAPIGPLPNLYIVADGMGGHNAGEIASLHAVTEFCSYFEIHRDFIIIEDFLAQSLKGTNESVYNKSRENSDFNGMGTTFTACCVDDNNLYFAHVGDSRIYAVKDDCIVQLTNDHSVVAAMVQEGLITKEEARVHPKSNIVTRAVGTDLEVEIDKGYYPIDGIKYFLLCSDGLSDLLCDEKIFEVVNNETDIKSKVDSLISLALDAGGTDNISVVILGWGGIDK